MTYEVVARFSQTAALLFFIGLSVSVLLYAFWPGNRQRFEEAQRQALDLGRSNRKLGDRS